VWTGCSANRGRGGEVVAGVFAVYAGGAGLEVEGWALAAAFGWLVAGFVMRWPLLGVLASLIGIAVSG